MDLKVFIGFSKVIDKLEVVSAENWISLYGFGVLYLLSILFSQKVGFLFEKFTLIKLNF